MNSFKFLSLGLALFGYSMNLSAQPLLVTGDYRGEIKPCGCSEEGDMGGIERASSFLKKTKTNHIWVDLGNFSAPATPQGELKSQLIYKFFKKNKLFAILPGPKEFQKGVAYLSRFPLPYLVTNQKRPFPVASRSKKKGGLTWYGYLSPAQLSRGSHQTTWLMGVKGFLARLSKREEKRALLFRGSPQELKEILNAEDFALVLVANQAESEEQQSLTLKLSGKNYLIPPLKGQGYLELSGPKDQKGKIHWLGSDWPNDKTWVKDFKAYDKKVEKLFFADMEFRQKQSKRVYKGTEGCVSCHQKQGEKWQTTRHAKAFESLVAVGKQYDPECIRCHVAGYQRGGFLSAQLTPKLKGVQCENCHGSFKPHTKVWLEERPKVDRMACRGCHNGSHSPNFKFKNYYPQIAHEN